MGFFISLRSPFAFSRAPWFLRHQCSPERVKIAACAKLWPDMRLRGGIAFPGLRIEARGVLFRD
jgi:hypothetical protein